MNIYVRNLSPTTSQAELMECFQSFGTVANVSISSYTVEGRMRASGFVEMPIEEHGLAAIEGLQGKMLEGNVLAIDGE